MKNLFQKYFEALKTLSKDPSHNNQEHVTSLAFQIYNQTTYEI